MNIFKRDKTELIELTDKVSALETLINDKDQEIVNLSEQVKNFDFEKSELVSELSAMKIALADKDELINQLQTKAETAERDATEFDNKVAETAIETIAKIGHVAIEIEPDTSNQPVMDVVSQFKKLHGKEAVEFYKEHKREINKALGK